MFPLLIRSDLAHNARNRKVDPLTGLTSNPKMYAAGDVIFGEGQGEAMVVSAAQQGKTNGLRYL